MVVALLGWSWSMASAGPLEDVPVAKAEPVASRSVVYLAHDPSAIDHLEEEAEPIGRMVGPETMKFTGWQQLTAEYAKQFGLEK